MTDTHETDPHELKISDLQQHERLAFGCLVRMMLRSDGHFTDEEEAQVNRLGEQELGDAGAMWHLISASAAVYPEEKDGKAEVPKVMRLGARVLILRVLERIAAADGVDTPEADLIDWVKTQWG